MQKRCSWAKTDLEILYHDTEWCQPTHDETMLFEFLILEGMQAGLSWAIILNKREAMREAFSQFDPHLIANYSVEDKLKLLENKAIIRNRLKINALVTNAQCFLDVQKEFGSFDAYIWKFTDGNTINNRLQSMEDMQATSEISDQMSKELKKRGFKFVGSTICYSYMQAIGMVNDHICDCFMHNSM
ncbi:MAG: DNA-3-methyladenine glycosylase I [Bacillota bacterium]